MSSSGSSSSYVWTMDEFDSISPSSGSSSSYAWTLDEFDSISPSS